MSLKETICTITNLNGPVSVLLTFVTDQISNNVDPCFVEDKIFTCIILSNADIRMYSSESPTSAIDKLPSYIKNRNSAYYILEIENESRPFVLSAKSHFDLEEWFNAIFAQIESLKTNRAIQRNTQNIRAKEQEMAVADQKKVRNITKFNMIFTPEI